MNAGGDVAALVALAGLPEVGPARLRALLRQGPAASVLQWLAAGTLPLDAELEAACGGRVDLLVARWRLAARATDVDAAWRRHADAGISVWHGWSTGWPERLADDPDPPVLVFGAGRSDLFGAPTPSVAVVGTRRCTRYGFDVARRLGGELAAAGVTVVSGLALGIDGAAHRGALDAGGAPPVGVVATGLDVVYPRAHRRLWNEVRDAGLLLSEAPLGTLPARWRFPARNRIIAALADVVVVVESAEHGGALHTVDEAVRRERPVLAVPGPVTSRASVGTNRLLADVAMPACDLDDILVALGLSGGGGAGNTPPAESAPLTAEQRLVLDAVGWTPVSLPVVVERSGCSPAVAALALHELEGGGFVAERGGWYERVRGAES